jgi:hypothetical protein
MNEDHNPLDSFTSADLWDVVNTTLDFNDVTDSSMSKNYNQHEADFDDLRIYMHSILNDSLGVEIEFKNENELEIFHFVNGIDRNNNWHISRNSEFYDSTLQVLGWTDSTISNIYEMLNSIDCISIASYSQHRTTFGYKRDGMGKYSYVVHDTIPIEKQNADNWTCSSIFFRDNVVFEYGSGAIGSICFPNKFMNKFDANDGDLFKSH